MPVLSLSRVYTQLYQYYGPQAWWPAETPFEVIVGAVLTQNTAWTNVELALANLKSARALSPQAILSAPAARLASWLKPSGFFNVKSKRLKNVCRWYIEQGELSALQNQPTLQLRDSLLEINGVGKETADAILLYALQRPIFVVDAYARRILSRLTMIDATEEYDLIRRRVERAFAKQHACVQIFNEFHALLVQHAKAVCRVQPRCDSCCLNTLCRRRGG